MLFASLLFLGMLLLSSFGSAQFEFDEPRTLLHADAPRLRAEEWEVVGFAEPTAVVPLRIALAPNNADLVEEIATDVSDPRSSNYGKYLSAEELRELVQPDRAQAARLRAWLDAAGVAPGHPEGLGDWYAVDETSVASVERLMNVRLVVYRHRMRSAVEIIRPALDAMPSVPASVAPLVAYVSGFAGFPRVVGKGVFHAEPAAPLPSGNAPLVLRVVPGDSQIAAFFMPRCMNGAPTTSPSSLCAENAPTIDSLHVLVNEPQAPASVSADRRNPPRKCQSCLGWSSSLSLSTLCNATTVKYGLSSSTVFCLSQPYGPFLNYLPVSFAMSQYYTGGNESAASPTVTTFTGEFVTPQTLLRAYNVPQNLVGSNSQNYQSVAEFLQQYYSEADLQQFLSSMGYPGQHAILVGPNDPSNPGGEASLDIQYMMGVARNISTVFWSVGGLSPFQQEPFDVWLTQVLGAATVPLVHSVSYADDESSLSVAFMQRVDFEFQKAAVRGLSMFFASGDNGVANSGPPATGCAHGRFEPSYPSSSPWVTSVGATQFSTQTMPACGMDINGVAMTCTTVGEIASSTLTGSRISSGGGFSNTFLRPAYQSLPVLSYIDNVLSDVSLPSYVPRSWYNSSGRAYPDVSACGRNYIVFIGGVPIPVDGTSAATPTFASVVSLLNDYQLQMGKPPLGFLNPLLYQMAELPQLNVFNDVVMGNNRCPEDLSMCCQYGLSAAVGFDLVTGLGTPNFLFMRELLP